MNDLQNNQLPLFSILIANYNNGHFFRDCYESMLSQTYPNWEVVIVDDASTDDSLAVMRQTVGDDGRFTIYVNRENKGCGYTKNRCSHLAKGDVCGFLDPDDALTSDALAVMMAEHHKHPEAAVITSRYELVHLDMSFLSNGLYGSDIPQGKSYLTHGSGALTAFATYKTAFYKQTFGIDPKMKRAVDQDLYYKLEERGAHIFVDKILYKYRMHQNSISANDNLYKAEYWHFYAINAAQKRRREERSKVAYFSNEYMRTYRSDYYLSRLIKLKFSIKFKAKYYFLWKSFVSNPTHKLTLKMKCLLLLILRRI